MTTPIPPVRPTPRHRPRGPLTPARLLLALTAAIALAYWLGERNRASRTDDTPVAATPATPAAAPAPARNGATPAPSGAVVVSGPKAERVVEVDDARMQLLEGGRVLRIEGGVGRRFVDELRAHIDANPGLQRLDITSGGGYTIVGFEAARLIQRNNLAVRVDRICASICVALWAAASSRQLEPDALIGLHQWNPQCDVMPSPQRERCAYEAKFALEHTQTYDAWLRSAGFSRELLALQARTPPQDIALLGAQELARHGVDFRVVRRAQ